MMVKAGKWLKSLLTGKGAKEKVKSSNKTSEIPVKTVVPSSSLPVPKEKKRWSFCGSRAMGKDTNCSEVKANNVQQLQGCLDQETDKKKNAIVVKATGTTTDANATFATEQIAADKTEDVEVTAATKIQAIFRAYLARKALCALKGIVKLQALVRGHLVRKHATDTLHRMQALIAVQSRAREQRIKMLIKAQSSLHCHQTIEKTPWLPYYKQLKEKDLITEENIKIVEVDHGHMHNKLKSKNDCSAQIQKDAWIHARTPTKVLNIREQTSPTKSALTDMSPRTFSGYFEEFSFTKEGNQNHTPHKSSASTVHGSERSLIDSRNDCLFFPSYMANTESSRAKARSHSAPKQRQPESLEKQLSRRRASVEGRNIPRSARMQRSVSHVSSTSNGYNYPNSIKLDRSNTSFVSSECGSTSTMFTNTRY